MLTHLSIKNYALIERLEMEPAKGFNTITGETGAGKSIMLGALGLLLGNRADTKSLFDSEAKCIIEGSFHIAPYGLTQLFEKEELDHEDLTVIRREITPAGKSRAFVNDTPVRLETLRELGAALMDIHSQHDTLALGENSFQLKLVDAYAQNEHLLNQYQVTFKTYQSAKKSLVQLQEEASSLKKEAEYNQYLFDELDKAKLVADEQVTLEEELKVLENAEEIKKAFQQALNLMEEPDQGISTMLHGVLGAIKPIGNLSPAYQEIFERLESTAIELADWVKEVEHTDEGVEHDPQRLNFLQDRLSLIYKLQQKHSLSSISELIVLYEELGVKVSKVANLDEELAQAKNAADLAEGTMREAAQALSESRTQVFSSICRELELLLAGLGIEDALLAIEQIKVAPNSTGTDEINVLFSANKGVQAQELKQVASGGEFSRLMFAIKYILADKMALPTMIFDEIDTGVSGEIAIKMGDMMKTMAEKHQVITISHLPQVAAKGNKHYFVYKDTSSHRTISRIKSLSGEERTVAIAQMISGENPTTTALQSARELLAQA